MKQTRHIDQRMNQRGISRDMIDFVIANGNRHQGIKYVLSGKNAKKLLAERQHQTRVLKRIVDKGGVVVVANDDALITTYNFGVNA